MRGRHAGPACGPRARWENGKGWQAGWAGWLARAEQAEAACEAYILSLLFLFCFSFHLFCLNSNLVLNFEFQIGAPNLLELLSISYLKWKSKSHFELTMYAILYLLEFN